MTKTDKRLHNASKSESSSKSPVKKPVFFEHETPNPLPDEYRSETRQPFTDDEENDPEDEGR
jgi:hypothetical protein